eukprot:TRINITY_DN14482_c0_g2_i2.p1 TRINITY_DN14482_c0_g2~~TRINITY_DN14482_c0_g2_i2.p1  ORF type:complete len:1291 (+),score=276.31 TRINITY_DN14482_c0_g2_i2:62-3874(+)
MENIQMQPKVGSKLITEVACIVVCGISVDATLREVHVLFSGCPGYLSSSMVRETTETPYALVKFEEKAYALQAAESRRGTVWEHGGPPVDLDITEHELIEQAALQEGERHDKPRLSRTSPGETSPGRPKSARDAFPPSENETPRDFEPSSRKSASASTASVLSSEHSVDRAEEAVHAPSENKTSRDFRPSSSKFGSASASAASESETLRDSKPSSRKSASASIASVSNSERCVDKAAEEAVHAVGNSSPRVENASMLAQSDDRETTPRPSAREHPRTKMPRPRALDITADSLQSSLGRDESLTPIDVLLSSRTDMGNSSVGKAASPGSDTSIQDETAMIITSSLQTSPACNDSAAAADTSVRGETGKEERSSSTSTAASKSKGRAASAPCQRRTPASRPPSNPRAKSPANVARVPDKSVLEDWQERLRKERALKKQGPRQKAAFGDFFDFEEGPDKTEVSKFTAAAVWARVRLNHAMEKRIVGDIEAALHEAEVAGVCQHETARAKTCLHQIKHRLNVRAAAFAQTKATNRISDAWKVLQIADAAPNRRIAAVHLAIREGREAANLCAKAEMNNEESKIRDALDFLGQHWSVQVQEQLHDATKRRDQKALVVAIAEAEAIKTSLQSPTVETNLAGQQVSVMDDLAQSSVGAIVSEDAMTSVPDIPVLPKNADDGALFPQNDLEKGSLTNTRWQLDEASWDSMLGKGRETLANEERRKLVLIKIEDALNPESQTFAKRSLPLEHLIQEGNECGLDKLFLARAEAAAGAFQSKAAARWALFGAAVSFQRDGTLLTMLTAPQRMRSAIKQAKNNGLGRRELQCAFELYENMETVHALQRGLAEALSSGEHSLMRERLNEARESGIQRQDSEMLFIYMSCIEDRLELEDKQAALMAQLKATLSSDRRSVVLTNLPKQMERAKELQLDISGFEQVFQQAKGQDDAQHQLEKAMVGGDVDALRIAIQVAKARDVNAQLLAAAETALGEEELLVDLNKAIQDEDPAAMEEVILAWCQHGFDKTVLEEASARWKQLLDGQVTRIQDQVSRFLESEPIRFVKSKQVELSKEGISRVEKLAEMLQSIPKALIRIDGHTSMGALHTAKTVMRLSQQRAETVMSELKKIGCPNPITAQGWGNTHPKVKDPCIRVVIVDSGPSKNERNEQLRKRQTAAAVLSPPRRTVEPPPLPTPLSKQLALLLSRGRSRVIDLFRLLDANSDGIVTKLELANALKELGVNASKDEVAGLFKQFDPDGNGGIEFTELRRAMHDELKREQELF